MDRTEAIIFIAVVAVCVALVLVAQIQSRTCPKCGNWRKTKTFRLDSSNMLLPHPVSGERTVINIYKCQKCGHRWEEQDSEGIE
jgi:predicted RNA-binding Zn-ribbon protein involved in translation (DUF1610 family)